MNDLSLISNQWLPVVNFVGLLLNAFLYWRLGGSRVSKDVMDLQGKHIEALKEEIDLGTQRRHELGNQLQVLSLKVGNLEGQIKEKDTKIEEYLAILQNRNPELEQVLKSIERIAVNLDTYMKTKREELHEIKEFMKSLDQRLAGQETRSNEIDTSTRREEGKVLRRGK